MERGSRYENLPSIKLDIKDNAKMQKPYSQKYSFFFPLKQLAYVSFILDTHMYLASISSPLQVWVGHNYQTLVCFQSPSRLLCQACLALEPSDQPALL